MNNAVGEVQTILLLGGTSDIGTAIVARAVQPYTRTVVLACRDTAKGEHSAAALRRDGLAVEVVAFDGADTAGHQAMIDGVATRHGDIDLAVVAFAALGDPDITRQDAQAAAALTQVDFVGAVSSIVAVGNRLREQGHGSIVVLSSVAGERVRAANPAYGASKAGLDGFCQGYGDWLAEQGVRMLVVRPGFVHSAMTDGMKPAPFATTPDKVAEVTVKALRGRRRTVWAPPVLQLVFSALRHLPGPVWRRLPLS